MSTAACGWSSSRRSPPRSRSCPPRWPRSACARAPCSTARARRSRDGLERLIDALFDRETILCLDNCEHLIGAAAALADTLLGACPGLRIVATSREPLAIAGENLVPVTPLGDDPAVELFLDRARAVSPGFAPTPAVAEICRRLDGLPLAIELAAARLRTMPVEQIAARLDDRFRLLTGGSRAALPRHRTLRAVVDWSWGLLDEDERVLARRLAVFQAGATEESAAAVCGVDDALDGLTALAERSLVVAGPRYRMLETIREYALEKLEEAGEVEATRTAHAQLVRRARRPRRARSCAAPSSATGSAACRPRRTT